MMVALCNTNQIDSRNEPRNVHSLQFNVHQSNQIKRIESNHVTEEDKKLMYFETFPMLSNPSRRIPGISKPCCFVVFSNYFVFGSSGVQTQRNVWKADLPQVNDDYTWTVCKKYMLAFQTSSQNIQTCKINAWQRGGKSMPKGEKGPPEWEAKTFNK